MKRCIVLILVLTVSSIQLFASSAANKEIDKQTYIYSIKGKDTLRLDKYETVSCTAEKPCVIFMFGGGFKGGSRDEQYNATYLENLAKSGYVAIGIDYRLGLKDMDAAKAADPNAVAGLLQQAVFMAVEDLYDATRFVYEQAEDWHINKSMIVANGSSAGAVAVLQGEYLIANKSELTRKLPAGFRYGGVIAFAGAIFCETQDLTWTSTPAPIQLFHGDADRNVPYDQVRIPDMGGLYGSKYIADQLQTLQAAHYFYDVENAAHEISGDPMSKNLEEIRSFITRYVIHKEALIIHVKSCQIGKPEMKKDFTISDYIQTNYQ